MFENLKITDFDNGARVVSCEMPNARTAAVSLAVRGSFRAETPETAGWTIVCGDLTRKGTKHHRDSVALDGWKSERGIRDELGYSPYWTVFGKNSPVRTFGDAIGIFRDEILNPLFAEKELEKEVADLALARKQNEESLGYLVDTAVRSACFGKDWNGLTVYGTEASMAGVTREKLLAHQRRMFAAKGAVLFVAGPFGHDKAVQYVEKMVRQLPVEEPFKSVPLNMPAVPEPLSVVRRPASEARLNLYFLKKGGDLAAEKIPAGKILFNILSDGMGSRLFRNVRNCRGLAYSVSASALSDPEYFGASLSGSFSPERLEEAVSCSVRELRKMAEARVSSAELGAAKELLIGREKLSGQTPRSVAVNRLGDFMKYGSIPTTKEFSDGIRAVTAEDVRALAEELFLSSQPVLALGLPEKGGDPERALAAMRRELA